MARMQRCPVCGKLPKVRIFPPNSAVIRYKPFFRKSHLTAVVAYAPPSQLQEAAVVEWNREVRKYGRR